MTDEAKKVFEDAKAFMKGRRSASWSDYNYFKQRLIAARCYDRERELADILHI